MSFIDHAARELNLKVSFYGPGLSGKTSNLQHIYHRTAPDARTQLVSLTTETERTLSFSFVPQTLAEVRGLRCRFHLYTVPGPVFYDTSRILVLRGADALVFVADSQRTRADANLESLENLETNLAVHGRSLADTPLILQYNKRDLPDVSSLAELDALLNPAGRERFEAVASRGAGVFETLKAACKRALAPLK